MFSYTFRNTRTGEVKTFEARNFWRATIVCPQEDGWEFVNVKVK